LPDAFRYQVVTVNRAGLERRREFVSENELNPGDVLRLHGRDWIVERVEPGAAGAPPGVVAKPARYRLVLRHPDGRTEIGAFRRFRDDAPRLGHAFTTVEGLEAISWQVVDQRLTRDDQGQPYVELVAERDYGEADEEAETLPDHELEHTLALREGALPEGATSAGARARRAGLAIELVALEAGEVPDWQLAEVYIDALVLEEIEDDLLELCGVDPARDPRDAWLATVKERLRSDLERFRDNVEGDHDEIEEWDFRGGRVFASVGTDDDESDPDRGHGWMCRLVDASALGAAGFDRVRRAEFTPAD
jgi:hypothetical protein